MILAWASPFKEAVGHILKKQFPYVHNQHFSLHHIKKGKGGLMRLSFNKQQNFLIYKL